MRTTRKNTIKYGGNNENITNNEWRNERKMPVKHRRSQKNFKSRGERDENKPILSSQKVQTLVDREPSRGRTLAQLTELKTNSRPMTSEFTRSAIARKTHGQGRDSTVHIVDFEGRRRDITKWEEYIRRLARYLNNEYGPDKFSDGGNVQGFGKLIEFNQVDILGMPYIDGRNVAHITVTNNNYLGDRGIHLTLEIPTNWAHKNNVNMHIYRNGSINFKPLSESMSYWLDGTPLDGMSSNEVTAQFLRKKTRTAVNRNGHTLVINFGTGGQDARSGGEPILTENEVSTIIGRIRKLLEHIDTFLLINPPDELPNLPKRGGKKTRKPKRKRRQRKTKGKKSKERKSKRVKSGTHKHK